MATYIVDIIMFQKARKDQNSVPKQVVTKQSWYSVLTQVKLVHTGEQRGKEKAKNMTKSVRDAVIAHFIMSTVPFFAQSLLFTAAYRGIVLHFSVLPVYIFQSS